MTASKCPSQNCGKTLTNAIVNDISLDVFGGKSWRGLAYVCPYCATILGVQMDPVALKTDTIDGVIEAIREG